ncbi:MAG: hypothetical protein KJ970_03825 [Candidatus Eisenbacteria bacterium]|uniref:Uncharacterized protein n=1 Tax=Eiseniibacteriota bacterium TaxID=2212470 RepID=A0A948RU54_UNCEI|nr:hypothetical protein [Candidatus Eisenbacteria bacterium]MBU2690031.1 hypothetical protein [Candidatus Eisenbacteria bacterium]
MENGWRDEWVCPCVGVWLNGRREKLEFGFNNVWGNVEGEYRDLDDLTGIDGNLSVNPVLRDSLDFRLMDDSDLRDKGNPQFTDVDGSPPDLGIEGGPSAAGR